jgi:phosphoglycolate phosphatase
LFSVLGVLWRYNNVLNESNKTINRFLDMGKKVYFITNNSTKTREELVEKAHAMNFNVGIVSNLRRSSGEL